MRTLIKYLLCFSLFAAPALGQTLDFIGVNKFARVGQYSYFRITAGRYAPGFAPKGWQLLVSRRLAPVPWYITGPGYPTPATLPIYLLPDAAFFCSLHNIHSTPVVFPQFRGVLDAKMQAAFEVRVPNIPCIIGHVFMMQVVLNWVPWSPSGCPMQTTNPLAVWISP